MKLPERVRTQQMSLGRQDVSAPGRLLEIQNQARAMILRDVSEFVGTVNDVFFAQDNAAVVQTKNSLILQNKMRNAELQAFLANTPQINRNDPNVPEEVRTFISDRFKGRDVPENIPTHTLMVPFMSQHMEKSIADALPRIPGLEAEFLNAMTTQMTGITADMVKQTVVQRQNSLIARADLNVDMAVRAGDLDEAVRIIDEAVESGAYTPEAGGQKILDVVQNIAKNQVATRISTASSQADLDLAAQDLFDHAVNLLPPDDVLQLSNSINSRRREIEAERNTFRNEQYMAGELLLMQGQLTEGWIADRLQGQLITAPQARSLRTALATPAPVTSDPLVLDRLRGRIAQVAYPSDAEPVPLPERVRQLQHELNREFSGLTSGGAFNGRRLSGQDYAQLLQELNNASNTALGRGSAEFDQAKEMIRNYTGVSDRIISALAGDAPNRTAYMAFLGELSTFTQNRGPGDMSPTLWVTQNAERFNPVRYENDYLGRMRVRFPRYADLMQDADFDWAEVVNRARIDRGKGAISEEKYIGLTNALQYKALMETGDVPRSVSGPAGW